MSLRPVYGHHALRARLAAAWHGQRLPASLLLIGRRGIGKQRLALWLGQLLVCERAHVEQLLEPCGECVQCRYATRGVHPDVHWFFPRVKSKDDPSDDDIKAELAEAIHERMSAEGLWASSLGMEGLHSSTMLALIRQSALRPAMASRAVFVLGDAERMVTQNGGETGANAFLKLLEEPSPFTTLILTTSEPGALLPTVRSRVVTMRVAPLSTSEVEDFLDDASVQRRFAKTPRAELLTRANGAPGELFAADLTATAFTAARRMLDAALQPATPAGTIERVKTAARHGVAGARGAFTDMLDALSALLHQRIRQLVETGRDADARRTSQALLDVEQTKQKAQGNVSPNLLAASLLAALHHTLKP